MPDIDRLEDEAFNRIEVFQTYLTSKEDGHTKRVRLEINNGERKYIYTHKSDIDAFLRYEDEKEITDKEYLAMLDNAITSTLNKIRYYIKYNDYVLEIDIYPFWDKQAILEIEDLSEDDEFTLPKYISVIREVSKDKRFSNFSLAKEHCPI